MGMVKLSTILVPSPSWQADADRGVERLFDNIPYSGVARRHEASFSRTQFAARPPHQQRDTACLCAVTKTLLHSLYRMILRKLYEISTVFLDSHTGSL